MAQASVTKIDRKTRWSEAEWETRVQLAACYRLGARYRMTDTIYTHISAPGTAGRTIPEAFSLMFYLERACEIQIAALAGGSELVIPSPEVCEKTARQSEHENDAPLGDAEWAAHIRALDREDASYRS